MNNSRPLLSVAILALVALSPSVTSAQVIYANAASDYASETNGSVMTPLKDTFGTGTWQYFMSEVTSDSGNPGALTANYALTYQNNINGPNDQVYGSTASYPFSSGSPFGVSSATGFSSNYDLPAVSNSPIFTGDAVTSGHLEVQPGSGNDAANLEWKSGAGETGPLSITFDINGPQFGNDNFSVYANGTQLYTIYPVHGSDTTDTFTYANTSATTLDFVLSNAYGVVYSTQADVSIQISSVPEPTSLMLTAVSGACLFAYFRNTRRLKI